MPSPGSRAATSVIASKWLIQTSCSSGVSGPSTEDSRGAGQMGPAVLAAHPAADRSTELLGDELGAVADPEDRNAERVDRRIEPGRAVDMDALGAARQDDRRRIAGHHLGRRHAVRHDLGVHVELADPAGDELRVLSAEVDDEHGSPGRVRVRRVQDPDGRQGGWANTWNSPSSQVVSAP